MKELREERKKVQAVLNMLKYEEQGYISKLKKINNELGIPKKDDTIKFEEEMTLPQTSQDFNNTNAAPVEKKKTRNYYKRIMKIDKIE